MSEEEKLPINFEFLEKMEQATVNNTNKKIIYYVICHQFQTDCLVVQKPIKDIVRML